MPVDSAKGIPDPLFPASPPRGRAGEAGSEQRAVWDWAPYPTRTQAPRASAPGTAMQWPCLRPVLLQALSGGPLGSPLAQAGGFGDPKPRAWAELEAQVRFTNE